LEDQITYSVVHVEPNTKFSKESITAAGAMWFQSNLPESAIAALIAL